MHGIDLEFKLNCCRTGDSLSFTGSSVAWGELVGEWPEGKCLYQPVITFDLECTLERVFLVLICEAVLSIDGL